ncbi:fengycin family lipopeptide synthetase D [Seinonella peptonophila]|uniref:Fengycin family lipopeptide synthetase D n=1 Tax=Seinonella peptonophila TaxID=112248 RepID=A0A1M4WEK0_9BACL|nr:non-ribosomal peptide synthetase [Seinonella peptonophila]SHE79580.1 fengycin family lipopeptide synthetase D [Seinonella peptonophila]
MEFSQHDQGISLMDQEYSEGGFARLLGKRMSDQPKHFAFHNMLIPIDFAQLANVQQGMEVEKIVLGAWIILMQSYNYSNDISVCYTDLTKDSRSKYKVRIPNVSTIPVLTNLQEMQSELMDDSYFNQQMIDHLVVYHHKKVDFLRMNEYSFYLSIQAEPDFQISFDYHPAQFDRSFIERMASHFVHILQQLIEKPNCSLHNIEIVTPHERNEIIYRFQKKREDISLEMTIDQLLEEQVQKTPHQLAVVYEHKQLTYDQLNKKANQLARMLRKAGVSEHQIVGLYLNRSIETIISLLAVLKLGAAYLPMDPNLPLERLHYMVNESGVHYILQHSILPIINTDQSKAIVIDQVEWEHLDDTNLNRKGHPHDLAYVIYTSGSTGGPKGVMIEHQGLTHLRANGARFQIDEQSRVLQFASIGFAVFAWEVYTSLFNGSTLYIASNEARLNLEYLVEWLNKHKITHAQLTPSVIKLLAKHSLPSLQTIVSSGERLTADIIEPLDPDITLMQSYGCSEISINLSVGKYDPRAKNNSIGHLLENRSAYIMNQNMQLQPIGIMGEICVGDVGLARGYLNQEALTMEKFIDHSDIPGGRLLKTGDFGRWLPDGRLEYVGRMDDQVQIRGIRVELGEVRTQILQASEITDCVVLAKEDQAGQVYLCAYIVGEGWDRHRLRKQLQTRLPEYMIPKFLIPLQQIPLNANRKVDRRALPEPDAIEWERESVSEPTNEWEKALQAIWEEVLETEPIGIDDHFFEQGGHSLKLTMLISRIYHHFQMKLSVQEVFDRLTIRQLATYLKTKEKVQVSALASTSENQQVYYPATSVQKRMFTAAQLTGIGCTYNTPLLFELRGRLDEKRLYDAIQHVVKRHESLRTSFHLIEGELMQKIHPHVEIKLAIVEGHNKTEAECLEALILPFDLAKAPLFRASLIRFAPDKHWLLFDFHHIVSDGTTVHILCNEISAFYNGKSIEIEPVAYKDVFLWQRQLIDSTEKMAQEQYWLNQFTGDLPVLNLPTDYPRPAMQIFEGQRIYWNISKDLTLKLKEMAQTHEVTLYMLLLAAYNLLLAKYTDQEDLVVGSLASGRSTLQAEKVVGMFVNTLALRNQPKKELTFEAFLTQVKERLLQAYQYADYSFEQLIEKLGYSFDPSRNPLFDTLFILQNTEETNFNLSEVTTSLIQHQWNHAMFDLVWSITGAEELTIALDFRTSLFQEASVKRMLQHFTHILEQIIARPKQALADFELVTKEEKQQILFGFNDTEKEFPKDQTIDQLFEKQVQKTPNQTAIVYQSHSLTYQELQQKVNQLARRLQQLRLQKGQTVGLMVDRSLELVIGLLAVMKAGGVYVPIDPEYPTERIQYLLHDSGSKYLLTKGTLPKEISYTGQVVHLDDDGWLEESIGNLPTINQPDDIAYVIYTSGSTGQPKGVMIQHHSVVNLTLIAETLQIDARSRVLQFASAGFDASIWEMIPTLVSGATLYVEDKEILSTKLLDYLNKNEISTVTLPPTVLGAWEPAALPKLKTVVSAGEACSLELATKWGKGRKFINAYGPTETTVCASLLEWNSSLGEVTIGQPIHNTKIYIVNHGGQLQPIGVPGELCVSGSGLAEGYLNQPALTAEKFVPNPFLDGEKMYKTGDMARWLPDGTIEYLGRIDDQVKIRGHRIELGEIEAKLAEYPTIIEAVVVPQFVHADELTLTAYIVAKEDWTVQELRTSLLTVLPKYMIPTYFVGLDALPLTPNGKVDKKSLPKPSSNIARTVRYQAPSNMLEEKLAYIWAEAFQLERVGIDDHFFDLGGHSLTAMKMIARIHRALSVEITLAQLFAHPTIRQLSTCIEQAKGDEWRPIESVPVQNEYPTTTVQKSLYAIYEESGTAYHVPSIWEIRGNIDVERLQASIQKVVDRHNALRTSFHFVDGECVQKVSSGIHVSLERLQVQDRDEAVCYVDIFVQPFDISKAPLMRCKLIQWATHQAILCFDFHHLIVDGISIDVLMKEISQIYQGEELEQPRIQFTDFAVWQQEQLTSAKMERQQQYWKEKLPDVQKSLDLPIDYPSNRNCQWSGAIHSFTLSGSLFERYQEWVKKQESTIYTTLLAVYYLMLTKYANREEIVIGCPVAGRSHMDVQEMVGMFVNTLPVCMKVNKDDRFHQFITKLRSEMLAAFEHSDCSVIDLLSQSGYRERLFDTVFVLQNSKTKLSISNCEIKAFPFQWHSSKFDLSWIVTEQKDKLLFEIEYCTDLFKEETISRMERHFLNLFQQVIENPTKSLREYFLVTEEEKEKLIVDFNQSELAYPDSCCIHELFEQRVKWQPDQIAVVYKEQPFTYHQLNQKANQLAHRLKEYGLQQEQLVGLMVDRSVEMIVGMIAVLKAGGAYLPLDPDYPVERIGYMLSDSGVSMLLTQESISIPDHYHGQVICVDEPSLDQLPRENLPCINKPNDLAYVIYTSGSTGKPKGVMIEHQGVCNLSMIARDLNLNEQSRVLQFASLSFDASVWEIYPTLIAGARLYIEDKESLTSNLEKILSKQKITTVTLTPTVLKVLSSSRLPHLITVVSAGEACPVELAREWGTGRRFINAYGPSEATVCVTYQECDQTMEQITIGRPIHNKEVFIMNQDEQLQPIGLPGELCVGGVGLARGYLNRPELTTEKFISNPFHPGRIYKTGDLARFLADGSIEYLGRMDEQVKIRGHRIEMGEIETVIRQYPAMKDSVVSLHTESNGQLSLVAYLVIDESWSVGALRSYLSKHLPDYMLPTYYLQVDEIPLTANGKLDKKRLPKPVGHRDAEHTFHAPVHAMEITIARVWEQILGIEKIGIHDNFFELGGDSIKAMQVMAKLQQENLHFRMKELRQSPTIAELIPHIKSEQLEMEQGIITGEVRLSPIQQYAISKGKEFWNVEMLLFHEEGWNEQSVRKTFDVLVRHHDAFRMEYVVDGERVIQHNRGLAGEFYTLEVFDLHGENDVRERMKEESARLHGQYGILETPLIRMGLFQTDEGDYLLTAVNHLVIDSVSLRVLMEDFQQGYKQAIEQQEIRLPKKTTSFQTWNEKIYEFANSNMLLKEIPYWKSVESSLEVVPSLPKDKAELPRRLFKDFDAIWFQLTKEETHTLLTKAHRKWGTEITEVLLAALVSTIRTWTTQNRVAVSLLGHGREDIIEGVDVTRTMGWFVTQYPVVFEQMTHSFEQTILHVKDSLRQIPNHGMGHMLLRYLTVADKKNGLSFAKEPEIHFNYHGLLKSYSEKTMPIGPEVSAVRDMVQSLIVRGIVIQEGRLTFSIHYHAKEFHRATIQHVADQYYENLRQIVAMCESSNRE